MRLTTLSLLVGLLATAAVVSAQDEQDCCAIAKAAMEGGGPIPFPRIILLGATGVGKSTLGNQLLGSYYGNPDITNMTAWLDAGCDVTAEKPFGVGHGVDSLTSEISYTVGRYLGNGSCVTIIDTQGFADTEGNDAKYVVQLAKSLQTTFKEGINVFLLVFKATENRFNQWTQEQLQIYETIFGKAFWDHAMTEFTFYSHNDRANAMRAYQQQIKCQHDPTCNGTTVPEEAKHEEWNSAYRQKLGVQHDIPSLFIDGILPVFSNNELFRSLMDPREEELFNNYTDQLWAFANSQPPFKCSGNCNAPEGTYLGEPWLEQTVLQKYEGENVTINCQVWTRFNKKAGEGLQWSKDNQTLYTVPSNLSHYSSEFHNGSIDGHQFTELTSDLGLGIETTMLIEEMTSEDEGTYECSNKVAASEVKVLLKVDCQWSEWGSWSSCSKSCIPESTGQLGVATRTRTSTPPKNGGLECDPNDAQDQRNCPYKTEGDSSSGVKFCPVHGVWGPWQYTPWGGCSVGCGHGTKRRAMFRHCTPPRHGGNACAGPASQPQSAGCYAGKCKKKWYKRIFG